MTAEKVTMKAKQKCWVKDQIFKQSINEIANNVILALR